MTAPFRDSAHGRDPPNGLGSQGEALLYCQPGGLDAALVHSHLPPGARPDGFVRYSTPTNNPTPPPQQNYLQQGQDVATPCIPSSTPPTIGGPIPPQRMSRQQPASSFGHNELLPFDDAHGSMSSSALASRNGTGMSIVACHFDF